MRKSNEEFVHVLQKLAGEQKTLMEHHMLPEWLGPANSLLARRAMLVIVLLSLCISIAILIVFFPQVYEYAGRMRW